MPRKAFLDSKSKILQRRPLVVGTLTGQTSLDSQLKVAARPSVDIVEIRLDTFPSVHTQNLISKIKNHSRKPILLTLRSHKEKGEIKLNDKDRFLILNPLIPMVELVDVEIRHLDFARRITKLAHQTGVSVIHSVHDFSGAADLSSFKTLCRWSKELKGDIFKIAVKPRSYEELETFLKWGFELKHPHPVFIGMGETGLISRYIAYSFGSILTYGHLGKSAAPGQPAVSDVFKAVESFYG